MLAEVLLWAVLLVQIGRLGWLVLAPGSVAGAPRVLTLPAEIPALAAHDPFRTGAPATAATGLDGWRLFGVRTAGDGRGSAILGQDGQPQAVYRTGDALAPGLVLSAVHADHVEFGAGRRLMLDAAAPATAMSALPSMPTAPPPPASPTSADIDPARLLDAGLQARTVDGRLSGYTLLPRGNSDLLLRAAGLLPGDVLLSVNGQVLSPGVITELANELKANPKAVVTFERDGETRTLSLGGRTP